MSADSFLAVLSRLRSGDGDAERLVFNRYAARLVGLARAHLDGLVRQKVDPEDVLQSAFKSFFLRVQQFDLNDWDNLWSLLTVITVRKCNRWKAHFRAGKRDVAAEVPDGGLGPGWQALAAAPTPQEVVLLAELVEGLLRGLPEANQAILTLALQGHSTAEISAQLNRPERTVQRVLQTVRERLERLQAEGAETA